MRVQYSRVSIPVGKIGNLKLYLSSVHATWLAAGACKCSKVSIDSVILVTYQFWYLTGFLPKYRRRGIF
jgi:hypothetical protein